ncbi:MAG TPA: extracellular solute-binding protein [Thermomicrobiales bacterium]|nr:extracellular solute-binding protein [Thermomicrobiales bacterium]
MKNTRISRRTFNGALTASIAALGAGVLSTETLHGVAAAAAQNGEVRIEYWHRSGGDAATKWEDLAKQFNEQFAGKVQVTVVAQAGIQELNQKVRAAAAGGGMPGALMADDPDVVQYLANDLIVPFDDYIADKTNGLTADQIAGFLPNQYNRQKLAIYGNKRMAFPQANSAAAFFWNVDALKAAGLDAPVKTWQEFPDHARKLADANPGVIPYVFLDAGAKFITTLKTYGIEWLKDDQKTANFDTPEALEVMTMWKQLSDDGLMQIVSDSATTVFASGKYVYLLDSSASSRGIATAKPSFTWDGGLLPQGAKDGKLRTETYGPINTLPKTTTEEQLAGWLWIKWLSTPDPLAQWVATTSYFPSEPAVADSDALKQFYTDYPVARTLIDSVAPYATIPAPHAALNEVRSTITADNVNEVLLGRLSPEDAVKKLQAEANDAISRANGN